MKNVSAIFKTNKEQLWNLWKNNGNFMSFNFSFVTWAINLGFFKIKIIDKLFMIQRIKPLKDKINCLWSFYERKYFMKVLFLDNFLKI